MSNENNSSSTSSTRGCFSVDPLAEEMVGSEGRRGKGGRRQAGSAPRFPKEPSLLLTPATGPLVGALVLLLTLGTAMA